jgi:branched-chain amino acid transport system permease protein
MTTVTAPTTATAPLDVRRAWSIGMPAGVGMVIVCAVGMALAFDDRLIVAGRLSLGWLTIALMPAIAGYVAATRPELEGVEQAPPGVNDVLTAALAGLFSGGLLAVFVVLLATIGDTLRQVLVNLSPQLLAMLGFDQGAGTAVVVALVLGTVVAGATGAVRVAPERVRDAVLSAVLWVVGIALLETAVVGILDSLGLGALEDVLYTRDGLTVVGAVLIAALAGGLRYAFHGRGGELRQRQLAARETTRGRIVFFSVVAVIVIVVPLLFDRAINDMLINVVIFAIMALGLNLVLGLAGMLDLGYVAFFAVGAYVTAVFTAPATDLAFTPELNFWVALPVALVFAVVAGIFIGTPVIRLRGDYLAIVTLGFAAIAQRLVVSDWFAPVLGGPQGVRDVPGVDVIVTTVSATSNPRGYLYLTIGFLVLVIYVAWRLQHSRLGRAWQAIREDETVAEAMGINVASMKLLAFSVGAVFAALAGGLFAAKVSSAFPTSFELLVSVLVLVVVIVGGTGYVPGVLLGSLVLVGVLGGPTTQGLLAEFANYKLLIYGALLVAMMLLKPQGLLPRPERVSDVAEEDMDQDAWFDKNVGGSSAVAQERRGGDGGSGVGTEGDQ